MPSKIERKFKLRKYFVKTPYPPPLFFLYDRLTLFLDTLAQRKFCSFQATSKKMFTSCGAPYADWLQAFVITKVTFITMYMPTRAKESRRAEKIERERRGENDGEWAKEWRSEAEEVKRRRSARDGTIFPKKNSNFRLDPEPSFASTRGRNRAN